MNSNSPNTALGAWLVAAASVIFVLYEQHVHITLSDPATYGNVLEHRCGIAMLLAIACAVVETLRVRLVEGGGVYAGPSAAYVMQ